MSAVAPSTVVELEALAETLERAAAALRERATEIKSCRKRGASPLRTSTAATTTITDLARARAEQALKKRGIE